MCSVEEFSSVEGGQHGSSGAFRREAGEGDSIVEVS